MTMWDVIEENKGGKIILSEGEYRVYEKTCDGTNRVGVYESKDVAYDVYKSLTD